MNSDLLAPITEEEVKAAAVQLGVWKVPGPYGFQIYLYQKYWKIMSNIVSSTAIDFHNVGAVTTGLRQGHRGLACGYVSWPGGGLPEVDMWHSVLALEGVAFCGGERDGGEGGGEIGDVVVMVMVVEVDVVAVVIVVVGMMIVGVEMVVVEVEVVEVEEEMVVLMEVLQVMALDVEKEILLKAVATVVPAYPTPCFKFPILVCSDINGDLARFWWKNEEGSKIH
ncbi:PREDICTED: reverse mRNAase [Prunus dulcis]|uniref:PREDICTED: reverse mRNAase n=1 Tax=Prunus dulcis TaxID=3755 RepID=A0A5E4FU20_PRUDU|nr:PREDICTED: reverse mRNAase [Prunus dulcis]